MVVLVPAAVPFPAVLEESVVDSAKLDSRARRQGRSTTAD
jgi:hypothetical protein